MFFLSCCLGEWDGWQEKWYSNNLCAYASCMIADADVVVVESLHNVLPRREWNGWDDKLCKEVCVRCHILEMSSTDLLCVVVLCFRERFLTTSFILFH